MPDVEKLVAWENGELEPEEEAELFQGLVDTRLAWKLQGAYGRRAAQLIRNGAVTQR